MKEYLQDQIGLLRPVEGAKMRPMEVAQETLVFDSHTEMQKRAENSQKIAQWNKALADHLLQPSKVRR